MNYVGVDLGQARDHTAIAVVNRVTYPAWQGRVVPRGQFLVRHMERVPLGTTYVEVVNRVREVVEHRELEGDCMLVVDATGVGAPVVDLLRRARLRCEICAVTITGGEKASQVGQDWHVPKKDLMTGVQVALQAGDLRIARGLKELGALVRELTDVQMTMGEGGRVKIGADGPGQHDDLVIALALGVWRGSRGQGGWRGGVRLPWI